MPVLCAVGFVFVAGPAFAGHATYRCSVKDVVRLLDNGQLGEAEEHYRRDIDGFIVDTLTGAISYSIGIRDIWRIVQNGGVANDYVLVPTSAFSDDVISAGRAAATDFLRIRAWNTKPQVTFIRFGLSVLWTGTCEIVR
jgi:hypothetical protein